MQNYGLQNEKDIILYLNKRQFKDLNDVWKKNIKILFPDIKDNDYVYASTVLNQQKPDITITSNRVIKYISIKSGDQVSVHSESLKNFINFLYGLGVSKKALKILLFYHYGDMTLDGTGTKCMDANTLKEKYGNYLTRLNKELNKKQILIPFYNRVLVNGINKVHGIDYLYYGDVNYGFMISKETLLNYLFKTTTFYLTTPHFGPFTYQPASRQIGHRNRKYMKIKWPCINSDISKIIRYY